MNELSTALENLKEGKVQPEDTRLKPLQCPVSHDFLDDPCFIPASGQTISRSSLDQLNKEKENDTVYASDPLTRHRFSENTQNLIIKHLIDSLMEKGYLPQQIANSKTSK